MILIRNNPKIDHLSWWPNFPIINHRLPDVGFYRIYSFFDRLMLENIDPHEVPTNNSAGPNCLVNKHEGKWFYKCWSCFWYIELANHCRKHIGEPIMKERHHENSSHRESNSCSFEIILLLFLLFLSFGLLMFLDYIIGKTKYHPYVSGRIWNICNLLLMIL